MRATTSTLVATRPRSTTSRAVSAVLAALLLSAALVVAAPTSADATVTACGDGRCTIYLSKSETRALADGRVPRLTTPVVWQISASYYSLAYGHKWFAQQYANRGWCSGFRLSVYPWESQGYFGYACNWN